MSDTQKIEERFPAIRKLGLNWPRRRIPIVRQVSSTDCGAAVLASVLAYHGKTVPLDELRRVVTTGRGGASAENILRVAQLYGLRGRAVRAELEEIPNLAPGTILYMEFRHFVVLERARKAFVDVVDPASGNRSIPLAQFRRSFTGVALLCVPAESFERTGKKQGRIIGLYKLVLEKRDLIARIVTTSLCVQLLSLSLPLMTGVLIDQVVPQKDYSLLYLLAIGYCACQIVNAAAAFIRAHLMIHLRAQLEARFTLRFVDHLIDLPYSFFQERTSGDLMMRLGSNNSIRDVLTSSVFSAFMDGTTASIYLLLLLLASNPVTLVVIMLAGLRLAVTVVFRWRQRILLGESIDNQARSQTYQVEMLSGMETLKAMGLEQEVAQDWSNVFVDGLNISIKRGRLDAMFNTLLGIIGAASSVTMTFYGTYLILSERWTVGTMVAFTAVANGFLTPLNNLLSSAFQLQMIEAYVERLNDVMDTPPEQDVNTVVHADRLEGRVSVDEVSFRYSADDPLVVQNVSIDIPQNARIAFVGRTGSGKSTVARLLAGLYQPTAGRILFDGRDIRCLERRSVRHQLGIVTQDTQLFGGSIRRNIALANPSTPLDVIIRAAKTACIHDDIMAMPMGYATILSDRGMSLSGGQRQRLAIARAVAGSPKILILDEATSHLDAVTELRVIENLEALHCTTIVIAHRLSTIRNANMILVFEAGRIVERGMHEEMISAGGMYASLLGAQADIPDKVAILGPYR